MLPTRLLCILFASVLLHACGGGSGTPATTVDTLGPGNANNAEAAAAKNAPNLAVGSITGFGSIIVDGVRYDDGQMSVWVESDGETDRPAPTTALRIGMQVTVSHDRGSATRVTIRSALRGPVATLDTAAKRLTMLGKTVQVVDSGPDATVFDGLGSLGELKTGDWLEIHGMEDPAGGLIASRIERTVSGDATRMKLSGRVEAIDLKASTLQIGAATVDFGQATVADGARLANGQRIAVFVDRAAVAGRLVARRIRPSSGSLVQASPQVVLGGLVTEFESTASLRVGGVAVDASRATFIEGTSADLADGATVRLDGTMQAGVLVANTVEFRKGASAAARNDLKGAVTDFVSLSNFKVRGQLLDASHATFVGGSSGELANGSLIAVVGRVVDGALVADQVTFQAAFAAGTVAAFDGAVTGVSSRRRNFRVAGIPMTLASDARTLNESLATLYNGRRIAVTGTFVADRFEVSTLEFKDDAPRTTTLSGIASEVAADRLTVSAATILIDDATRFVNGARSDLVDGLTVKVSTGRTNTGALLASEIELPAALPADGVEVHGLISDFVSLADLRIAGQRADASAAVITVGADAMNGRMADGVGVMVDGVLKLKGLLVRDAN